METRITIKVNPNSPRNEVAGYAEGILKLRLAAPPVRDKANKELVDFLSQLLGLRKSDISILRGHTSRNKVVAISGLTREEVIKRLVPPI